VRAALSRSTLTTDRGSGITVTVRATASTSSDSVSSPASEDVQLSNLGHFDLLVVGAVASDTSCDYLAPDGQAPSLNPLPKTSNPSHISQSAGGVGRNVAVAAHLAGAGVALSTVVANDIAGISLLDQLQASGLPASYVRQLKTADGARTAHYVAVNDGERDLVLAMADMSILMRPELESIGYWKSCMASCTPKWGVVDGNWSSNALASILSAAKSFRIPMAFEPVSTAKAIRLFDNKASPVTSDNTVPNQMVDLASPNSLELTAMYLVARDRGYFESQEWWHCVDNFGLSDSGSREKMAIITSNELVDRGIPQQALQLLPYVPNLVVKLGSEGCLLVQILKPGDGRLTKSSSASFVLGRNLNDHPDIGGVYMRLFPPHAHLSQQDIVSVNGAGDTMLGVIMAGLLQGRTLEVAIPIGQEAAVLSLKSREAVSPSVSSLQTKLA
jgi:sugar/nucleoside kinase (ribokinase family)